MSSLSWLVVLTANQRAILARTDSQTLSQTLRDIGVSSDAPLTTALPEQAGCAVIDFSHASVTPQVIEHCAQHGMPLAIGTTGIEPDELNRLLDQAAKHIPILAAPNMSVGVNVVFQIAAKIAQVLGTDYDIEIVEAHHHHKVDAPSGTAYGVADAITAATGRTRADLVHGREGQCGARRKGEIGMHALRMGDVVGDHTAYFVGNGERIMLGHLAHSRDIFAQGALRAAAFLAVQQPGRYDMAAVLGFGLIMAIRAVSFDLHGTLALPEPAIGQQYADEAQHWGIDADPQCIDRAFYQAFNVIKERWPIPYGSNDKDAHDFWCQVIATSFARCGFDAPPDLQQALFDRFAQAAWWRVLPQAKQAWDLVNQYRLPIAVTSNFDARARNIVNDHGFAPVACWAISAEHGFAKPDPRMLTFVCDSLKVQPQELLHIGDKPSEDGEAARLAGCPFLLVDPNVGIDVDQLRTFLDPLAQAQAM